jgi:tetratricopeptide (TPR) repeat protein
VTQPLAALLRRRDRLLRTRGPADDAVLAAALAAIADHPQAAGHPDARLDEILGLLAECRANLRDFDGAVEAMERAIAAGWTPVPDPRCELAHYHLRAGRRERAEALFEEVRRATPDEVWLYNSVGLSFQSIDDHETALRWLTGGLELALSSDDPEGVVAQLTDLRSESLETLGRPRADALNDRADAWLASRRRPRREDEDGDALEPERGGPPPPVAMAWVAPQDFPAACEQWAAFGEEWGGASHAGYSRALEGKLVELRSHGIAMKAVAPLRLSEYLAWAADQGHDPSASATRASYAAEQLRCGVAVRWPPGRNEPCWCASGRKYKKCCASPRAPVSAEVGD